VGEFALLTRPDGDYVFVRLSEGAPPAAAVLHARVSAGAPGRERRAAEVPGSPGSKSRARPWRIGGGPFGGDGFVVRKGAPAEMTLDVPAGMRLLFDVACVEDSAASGPSSVTLRARLDDAVLLEREFVPSRGDTLFACTAELPADGASSARLSLTLDGDAWCGVFNPRIAPVAPPADERRAPDIVLFLADTFRADNVAFYGGMPGLTPELDAFADASLRVERAYAPSCWTLPSHASMFLGVAPMQHGATGPRFTPAGDLVAIAEKLRDAGYRTAAVTDSLFVSRRYSIDRGFEHFEEYNHRDIERTVRRAQELAARDDGRPLFLFVHTYRTHEPYEVTPETLAALGEKLGIGPTWKELETQVLMRAKDGGPEMMKLLEEGDLHAILLALGLLDPGESGSGAFLAAIRALYLGGVHDLDRAFGELLDGLDARKRDTFVLFTSDHGEAFGEHETIFHGFGVWEESLRIPLLIRGPGLKARTLAHPASLVDVPHTLAEIAGIAPDPRWAGRSLLSLKADRPIFAFDCAQRGDAHGAVIDDGLKVIFEPTTDAVRDGRVTTSYDLDDDPRERTDLGAAPRAKTVLERLAEDVLKRMEPLAAPGQATLDAAQIEQMRAVGYAGGDDD